MLTVLIVWVSASVGTAEVRALWVVRNALTSPASIERMVDAAAVNGFNTLIVQVRGRGDAFYQSRYEPRAAELAAQPADFDPLGYVLQLAHARHLKVHAWVNTYLIASAYRLPGSRGHLLYQHPEWLSIPEALAGQLYTMDPSDPGYLEAVLRYTQGRASEVEGIYLDPAHPGVQAHVLRIAEDLLSRYLLDGVHFDYVRYPDSSFGYSRTALELFAEEMDDFLPAAETVSMRGEFVRDRTVYPRRFAEQWNAFRRQQVTSLVEQIYTRVKASKPEVLVTAAVGANMAEAESRRLQDWRKWLELGILDAACPMAYSTDSGVFKTQIENARTHSGGRQIWAGIGAYRISPGSAVEKIQISRRLQADGFVLFSYNGLIEGAKGRSGKADYLGQIGRFLSGQTAPGTSSKAAAGVSPRGN